MRAERKRKEEAEENEGEKEETGSNTGEERLKLMETERASEE